jgi:hypothetical protein
MSSWRLNNPWLIQRIKQGIGYKNPWGDVNNTTDLKGIERLIQPDYMGAAEFEYGAYHSTLERMVDAKFRGDLYLKKIPIKIWEFCDESDDGNVVSKTNVGVWISVIYWCSETTTLDDITARIQRIADRSNNNPNIKWHSKPETSKNDYSSFYNALIHKHDINSNNDKLATGWIDVGTDKHCGLMWFVDDDFAVKVMKYFSKLSKAKHNEMINE